MENSETKYILKWSDRKDYVGSMCSFVKLCDAVQYDSIEDVQKAQERIKNRFKSETKIFELITILGKEIDSL